MGWQGYVIIALLGYIAFKVEDIASSVSGYAKWRYKQTMPPHD